MQKRMTRGNNKNARADLIQNLVGRTALCLDQGQHVHYIGNRKYEHKKNAVKCPHLIVTFVVTF